MLTGFVLFVPLSEHAAGRGPQGPMQFVMVLLSAIVVTAIIEHFREVIRAGDTETRRLSLGSILTSVLLLAVFELCSLAWDEVSQTSFQSPYVLREMTARVTGAEAPYAFLSGADILAPDSLLTLLAAGFDAREPTPAARIVSAFGEETRWTLFPDRFPKPALHDARARQVYLVEPFDPEFGPDPLPGYERPVPDTLPVPPRAADTTLVLVRAVVEPGASSLDRWELESFARKVNVLRGAEHEKEFRPDPHVGPLQRIGVLPAGRAPPRDRTVRDLTIDERRALLAAELNIALTQAQFYEPAYFAQAKLPPTLRAELAHQLEAWQEYSAASRKAIGGAAPTPTDAAEINVAANELVTFRDRLHLNRAVLDATFPGLIAPGPSAYDSHYQELAVLVVLWTLAGAILGWFLGGITVNARGDERPRPGRSALRGALAAIVLAPAGVIVYVAIVRIAHVVHDVVSVDKLAPYTALNSEFSAPGSWAFVGLVALRIYALFQHWLLVLAVLVAAVASWYGVRFWRRRRGLAPHSWPVWRYAAGFLALFLGYVLLDLSVLFVGVLVAALWFVPGAFLGASVPYLRTGSALPKRWGLYAMIVGSLLIAITLVRLAIPAIPWSLGLAGGVLLSTGILMHRGHDLADYWPLAAVSVSAAVCLATSGLQRATFNGVLADIHSLNTQTRLARDFGAESAEAAAVVQPGAGYAYVWPGSPSDPRRTGRYSLSRDALIDDPTLSEQSDEFERDDQRRLRPERTAVANRLELSLVGSLGFWLTIGILASWAIVSAGHRSPHHRRHPAH